MSLRRRIADNPTLNRALESLLERWVRFCFRTSDWTREGFEVVDAEIARGEPMIFCAWHQRLVMVPYFFDTSRGRFCTLTSSARAGRLVGRLLGRFGMETVPMSSHKRHVALSREVLRRIREGCSIGIAVDGPRGPARHASSVPLIWSRSTGKKVIVIAYSTRRCIKLPAWDRMMLPMPWTRGALVCRAWDKEVPKGLTEAELEALRLDLQHTLDVVTERTNRIVGRRPDKVADQISA